MSTKKPPIPAGNRNPKDPTGSKPDLKLDKAASKKPENIEQTGDRANIRQNATNQDFKHRR